MRLNITINLFTMRSSPRPFVSVEFFLLRFCFLLLQINANSNKIFFYLFGCVVRNSIVSNNGPNNLYNQTVFIPFFINFLIRFFFLARAQSKILFFQQHDKCTHFQLVERKKEREKCAFVFQKSQ